MEIDLTHYQVTPRQVESSATSIADTPVASAVDFSFPFSILQ